MNFRKTATIVNSDWCPCNVHTFEPDSSPEICLLEEKPIKGMIQRRFSIVEHPIRCLNVPPGAGGSLHLRRILTNSEAGEVFGAELSTVLMWEKRMIISASDMALIKIWEEKEPDVVKVLKGHYIGWVNPIVVGVSTDGKRIVSGGEDGVVRVWNLRDMESLTLFGLNKAVHCVKFRWDGKGILFGSSDGTVTMWSWESAEEAQRLKVYRCHEVHVYAIAERVDGSLIATGGGDGAIRLWGMRGGRMYKEKELLLPGSFDVHALCFSGDGRLLAFGLSDGHVGLWNTEGDIIRVISVGEIGVGGVGINPVDDRVVYGLFDGRLGIWDWRGSKIKSSGGHDAGIWSVVFDRGGEVLVTGGADESVRIWDASLWGRGETRKRKEERR